MVKKGRTGVRGELVLISFALSLCGAGGCGPVRHKGGLNPALLHRQPGSSVHRLLGFRMSLRGGVARTVLTSSDSSDERNPPGGNAEIHSQPTTEDLMQKMIGALVTVTLKIGPQIRGRLLSIDKQWNIMLQKPVEQWVNNTLVAVEEADVFVRYHNVIDFGVLRGTEDPATVKILQDMGLRPGEEGWGDEPNPNKFSSEAEYVAASQARK